VADRQISEQFVIGQGADFGVNLVGRNAFRERSVHQLHAEGSAMAAVTNGDIKAGVGTDEIGVHQCAHHFGVSGMAKLFKLLTVTLTADDGTGDVGIS
jgi:hypothetical protein